MRAALSLCHAGLDPASSQSRVGGGKMKAAVMKRQTALSWIPAQGRDDSLC
ncbi:MAG: hypothetical protein ACKVOE_01560 [Rickettsiales bacterium]